MQGRIGDANVIGHLTLLLVAGICAFAFRGIPDWLWLIVYVFSAFLASSAWQAWETRPAFWLLGAGLGGGLTYLLYLVGVRFLDQPWLVFKLGGMLAPLSLLICVSGFVRTVYMHFGQPDGSSPPSVG